MVKIQQDDQPRVNLGSYAMMPGKLKADAKWRMRLRLRLS